MSFFFVAWGKDVAVIRHFKRYSSMDSAKKNKTAKVEGSAKMIVQRTMQDVTNGNLM